MEIKETLLIISTLIGIVIGLMTIYEKIFGKKPLFPPFTITVDILAFWMVGNMVFNILVFVIYKISLCYDGLAGIGQVSNLIKCNTWNNPPSFNSNLLSLAPWVTMFISISIEKNAVMISSFLGFIILLFITSITLLYFASAYSFIVTLIIAAIIPILVFQFLVWS